MRTQDVSGQGPFENRRGDSSTAISESGSLEAPHSQAEASTVESRLARDPWFARMCAQTRTELLLRAAVVHRHCGEYVFRKGDTHGGLFALLSGRLKASTLREDGKEGILVVLEPVTWFGEASNLDGLPRSHDVSALEDATLLYVDAALFNDLMEHNSFARCIGQLQASHIRLVYSLLEAATLRSTRARVACRLRHLAERDLHFDPNEPVDEALRPVINITHDTLAMMLGITRQTLALELKELVAKGAISTSYGRIRVESVQILRDVESKHA